MEDEDDEEEEWWDRSPRRSSLRSSSLSPRRLWLLWLSLSLLLLLLRLRRSRLLFLSRSSRLLSRRAGDRERERDADLRRLLPAACDEEVEKEGPALGAALSFSAARC